MDHFGCYVSAAYDSNGWRDYSDSRIRQLLVHLRLSKPFGQDKVLAGNAYWRQKTWAKKRLPQGSPMVSKFA